MSGLGINHGETQMQRDMFRDVAMRIERSVMDDAALLALESEIPTADLSDYDREILFGRARQYRTDLMGARGELDDQEGTDGDAGAGGSEG